MNDIDLNVCKEANQVCLDYDHYCSTSTILISSYGKSTSHKTSGNLNAEFHKIAKALKDTHIMTPLQRLPGASVVRTLIKVTENMRFFENTIENSIIIERHSDDYIWQETTYFHCPNARRKTVDLISERVECKNTEQLKD